MILKSRYIPEATAKEHIDKEETYNEELAQAHFKILRKTSGIKTLFKKLKEIISEEAAVKILDIYPKNKDTVKLILNQYEESDKLDEVLSLLEVK